MSAYSAKVFTEEFTCFAENTTDLDEGIPEFRFVSADRWGLEQFYYLEDEDVLLQGPTV